MIEFKAETLGSLTRHVGERPVDFYDRVVNAVANSKAEVLAWESRSGVLHFTGCEYPEHWHTLAHRSVRVIFLDLDPVEGSDL